MEWIEITGVTVEEAKTLALESLGVHHTEAEFEIIESPSSKMFGLRKTEARVRARVKPVAPAPKRERRDRKKKNSSGRDGGGRGPKSASKDGGGRNRKPRSDRDGGAKSGKPARGADTNKPRSRQSSSQEPKQESPVEQVEEVVQTFLNGLVASFGFEDSAELSRAEDDGAVEASVPGRHGVLIGPKGRTLDAVQELTRVTAQRAAPSSTRIRVDVGGYRAARKEALAGFAVKAATRARDEGTEVRLEPMSSPDRKVVHDALIEVAGVSTRSVGEDPRRRVVIVPDASNDVVDGSEQATSDSSEEE